MTQGRTTSGRMTTHHDLFATTVVLGLLCTSVSACGALDEPDLDLDLETSRSGEVGELVLANGNILVFIDEDPSDDVEIALIEIAATPEPGRGAIEQMKAAGATPAELWLSASEQQLPLALAEAHADERAEAPHAFSIAEHLLENDDDDEFRGFAYGGAWGGYDGYCDDDFASDWDAWAGAADATAAGSVGFGATVDLTMTDATDAWIGVCNDTPWNTDMTFSKMVLYRDISGAPTWSKLRCSGLPSASWCSTIGVQTAKAMHFWSGTTYDFKGQAAWTAGVAHDVMLRARSE